MGWYVSTSQGPKGPFGDPQIVAAIRTGEITTNAQICTEGGETWIALKDYPPFAAALPAAALPAAALPADSPVAPGAVKETALGFTLLGVPLLAAAAAWVLPGPAIWFGIIVTSLLMALEAQELGMGKLIRAGGKKDEGPILWFLSGLVLWIAAYPMYLRRRRFYGRPSRAAVGLVVAFVMIGAVIFVQTSRSAAAQPIAAEPTQQAVAPAVTPPPTRADLLNAVDTLDAAIRMSKPLMADTRGEEVSTGAALLANWWSQRPGLWKELLAMPDTRRADILKDPDTYRGQRICVTGTISQIFRDKSASSSIYLGVLYHSGSFVRFIAVQSTQGVVERSMARFCGIAIGVQSYPNVSGGTTIAVQVVGAFDLPANGGKGLQVQYDDE